MPHLVQLDDQGAALGLRLPGVGFREPLDPGLDGGRRHAEQLGGPVHRDAAQVEQHRLHLHPQRHPPRRRVGEVQAAGLAAVALLAAHEAVLDLLLAPATLAPQRHPTRSVSRSKSTTWSVYAGLTPSLYYRQFSLKRNRRWFIIDGACISRS